MITIYVVEYLAYPNAAPNKRWAARPDGFFRDKEEAKKFRKKKATSLVGIQLESANCCIMIQKDNNIHKKSIKLLT